jgi:multiple sugar transport system substrate-binding protein
MCGAGFLAAAMLSFMLLPAFTARAAGSGETEATSQAKQADLQVWSSGVSADSLEREAAAFTEKNPNVEIEVFATSHNELHNKLSVAYASDAGPDVCHSKNFYGIEYAARGVLLEIDTFFKRDYDELEPDKDPTFNSRIDAEGRLAGKLYAIPMTAWWESFMYNERLLREAGMSQPPDNWAEYRQMAIKLTKDTNGDGRPDIWGTKMYAYNRSEIPQFNWSFNMYALQNGVEIVQLDKGSGKPIYNLNHPKAVEALQWWVDNMYVHKCALSPLLAPDDLASSVIENEKVAMWIQGPWVFNNWRNKYPDLPWKIARMPKKENRKTIVEGHTAFIAKSTKFPEESWSFIKHMCSLEADLISQKDSAFLPIRDRNWENDPWVSREDYVAHVKQIRTDPYWVMFMYKDMNEQLSKAAEIHQEVIYTRASVQETLDKMQQVVSAMVE